MTTWNDIAVGTLYTAALAHNILAADIQTALEGIYGVGEVTVTDDTDFTIEFDLDIGDSDLVADFDLLTGETSPTLTITQAYNELPLTGTNGGTKPCHAIFTLNVQANIPDIKITLDETGEYLYLDYPLVIGDVVVWNTSTRTIHVNAVNVREYIDFDSEWFKLPVGVFTISALPAEVRIEVEYRERWI